MKFLSLFVYISSKLWNYIVFDEISNDKIVNSKRKETTWCKILSIFVNVGFYLCRIILYFCVADITIEHWPHYTMTLNRQLIFNWVIKNCLEKSILIKHMSTVYIYSCHMIPYDEGSKLGKRRLNALLVVLQTTNNDGTWAWFSNFSSNNFTHKIKNKNKRNNKPRRFLNSQLWTFTWERIKKRENH